MSATVTILDSRRTLAGFANQSDMELRILGGIIAGHPMETVWAALQSQLTAEERRSAFRQRTVLAVLSEAYRAAGLTIVNMGF